jgi:hypothetical protein
MIRQIYQISGWVMADPVRLRLVIMSCVLVLMIASALIPGFVLRAEDAPGGGH